MIPALLTIAVIFFLALSAIISNLIYVCSPNEALIFAGGTSKDATGAAKGYRVIKGGKGVRIPLLETVHRMDLTLISIDVAVAGAYSKGGIPLNVAGVANVKVAGRSPELDNAIQRFLGLSRDQIEAVAKDTLEGALRGIVATMTPEDLNENKAAFERALESEARDSLQKIGLSLDTLKIQSVEDRVGYLSAIGEKEKAALFQRARIAEATNQGQSSIRSSENRQEAEIAKLEAEIEMTKAEGDRRVTNAVTAGDAMVAEQIGHVKAVVSRARADLDVQKARIEQIRLKLQADVVEPAKADMEARIRAARGKASKIREEGRAMAEGLKSLVKEWKAAGSAGREILLLQKLEPVLETLMSSIDGVEVNRYAVLANDSASGEGGHGGGGSGAMALMRSLEKLNSGTGLDVVKSIGNITGVETATLKGLMDRFSQPSDIDIEVKPPKAAAPKPAKQAPAPKPTSTSAPAQPAKKAVTKARPRLVARPRRR